MKSIFTLSILFISIYYNFGQLKITGSVKDENALPVAYASIALTASTDSILIMGALTKEDGTYSMDNVSPGTYRILASYIGYENVYSDIFTIKTDSKSAVIDINFLNKGIALAEAVVTAKKPFLEQKSDRLIVNVSNSALAAGGTAMEILQKVPGVVVMQEKVTLGGSQSLQIWVDGKPSPYTDMNALLRDMPGDQIEKIELITQPGAQYDAAGGPILNIVLKRNADLGFKGTAALALGGYRVNQNDVNGGIKYYYRLNPSVNMTYRSGKINLFGNTSYNQGDYFTVRLVDRYINNEVYKSENFEETDYAFRNVRVGADYYITDKTTIGTVLRAWGRDGNGTSLNGTDVYDKIVSEPYYSFITENTTDSKRAGYYGNFNIRHDFNKHKGSMLLFDIDYNKFNGRNINDLQIYPARQPIARSISKQDVNQPVNIWVSKVDYKIAIDTTFKIETGLKTSFSTVQNDLLFTRNNILSVNESNDFLYKENINAAYINGNKTIGKIEFNAGLRTEQTIVSGVSEEIKVLDRNYTQWFPSASALYKLNQHMGIQSSYSKRVNRPGFQQQNPFSYFIDSLTYTRGNPNLKPEIVQTGQLNVVFDGQPFMGVSYSKTNDVIIENAPQLEGTKTYTTSQNLAVQERLEIQLNFPIKIGKIIDGFGGNQAIRNSYNATYLGTQYKASRWHWLAYWQINANLPKDIKLEFGGFYMTKFLEEFLVINNLGGANLGLSKTFLDGKARVALSYNDIFYSQKTNAVIAYQDVNVNFFQREYSRNLRLNFSYNFGNTKMKNNASRSSASESESSRVKID